MNSKFYDFIQELKASGVKSITIEMFDTEHPNPLTEIAEPVLATNEAVFKNDEHPKVVLSEKTKCPAKVVEQIKTVERPVEKTVPKKQLFKPTEEDPKTSVEEDLSLEAFCKVCEMDDGSKKFADLRARIISKMSHDDLLRVNNEFGLGVDTDVPVETIRTEIASMF